MIPPEVYGRFLRPSGLKDQQLDAPWSDSQHAWMPHDVHGYIKVRIMDRRDDQLVIQKSDNSVIIYHGVANIKLYDCRQKR